MTLLTRARLRADASVSTLRPLLDDQNPSARAGLGHRLLWSLFADSTERERDFLWREMDHGEFLILSERLPVDVHGIFHLDPSKPFAPLLTVGEQLGFSLRANATKAKKSGDRSRGKPVDVVMDAIHDVPRAKRAEARQLAVQSAGLRWLAQRGDTHGFSIGHDAHWTAKVSAYRVLDVEHAGPQARFGVLDFDGVLEVVDPARFCQMLSRGLGRAKGFGCGLMLVRRVRTAG